MNSVANKTVVAVKNKPVKSWLRAFRLRTLPLSFSNILLGTALAFMMQNSEDNSNNFTISNWIIFALTLITTLLLQILSNLANDYGDAIKGADNEGRVGPMRAIQSGDISLKAMLWGIIITTLLALFAGIVLLVTAFEAGLNWQFLVFLLIGILAIAAAIKYTIGKRAYGYSGLGDLFVFIFFGLVGVLGTYYLQTGTIGTFLIFPAITMGCFSVAVLNLNNMRDQVNDKVVGKNTLVVKFGFEKSKRYHFILFIIAYTVFPLPFMLLVMFYQPFYLFAFLPVIIIHLIHLKKVRAIQNPSEFDPELKKVALSAFLFSLLFFVLVVILH